MAALSENILPSPYWCLFCRILLYSLLLRSLPNSATCQPDPEELPGNGLRTLETVGSPFLLNLFSTSDMNSRQFSTNTGDRIRSDLTDNSQAEPTAIYSTDFEVQGTVQGVFFRKYTQKRATELGLVGWVRNDESGSVVGHLQGSRPALDAMKDWLQRTGSPQSRITKCTFTAENKLDKAQFSDFQVRH
ncbi:putative Acylphosphatase-1 [Hypsibius exemplaris]|uniref:Acylphosphatase n=1 Tax=Hypsibius exemplaris TaxID=2072580 RepID=A0A1W0WRK2_HYPEX|nr:putative Acylphosphatase-1 [Hypsibius exemplaris]